MLLYGYSMESCVDSRPEAKLLAYDIQLRQTPFSLFIKHKKIYTSRLNVQVPVPCLYIFEHQ